jgi:predicted AlkP superfamily pyrophosphatase or phosphodiesterase
MLPAPFSQRLSLADVMPSLLASVLGEPNSLGLPRVRKAIVVLVDGLGAHMVKARVGHARTLASATSTVLASGFPTTTAAALTTLTTGSTPGTHGMVGYTARDPSTGRVVNLLSGWDAIADAATWQRSETVFERAASAGIPSFAVGAARYETSGFTSAVLRGAEYLIASDIRERLESARRHLSAAGEGIAYVYVPELDQLAHRHGWSSDSWITALEELDAAMRAFAETSPPGEGVLLTADHGMVDVASHNHVHYDELDGLLDGVAVVAGEPRCLQVHFDDALTNPERAALTERWRSSESSRSWVVTREEAVAAGWFGSSVDPAVLRRIGDLVVAARKTVAYYDSRTASASGLAMVGQHGSLTPEESRVPLLRFGAYA